MWQDIINEIKNHDYKFIFYGFHSLKPNIQQLITKVAQNTSCLFHFPIIKNNTTELVQHTASAEELEWLKHEISNSNTIIASNEPDKIVRVLQHIQPYAATNTFLLSTTIAQSAIHVLNACGCRKLERNTWLPLMQIKFSGNKSLTKWANHKKSLITKEEAQQILAPEIILWLETFQQSVASMPKQATFTEWASIISELLSIAGWPFKEKCSDQEIVLLRFWQINLQTWANQDINNKIHLSYDSMLEDFHYFCKNSNFRTQSSSKSQVMITTIKELDGLTADRIIILGANSKLVAEESDSHFKRWQAQTKSLIFSQALVIADEPTQKFAPLIKYNIKEQLSLVKATTKLNYTTHEFHANVIHNKPSKISSRLINEYASCPIKAVFNTMCDKHNLTKSQINEFAMMRGTVVHDVLAEFWSTIKSSTNLAKLSQAEIESKLRAMLNKIINQQSKNLANLQHQIIHQVEINYLIKLLMSFINIESTRAKFEVVQIEQEREITVLGYKIKVRLDRVDQTENGLCLIDYKTGAVTPSNWLGSPPKDPQIPLYLSDENTIYQDVSYACINKNSIGYKGYQHLRQAAPWQQFVMEAKASIEQIVQAIINGNAPTKPIQLTTCSSCNLNKICRPESIVEQSS